MITYIEPRKVAKSLWQAIQNESAPQSLSDFNKRVAYHNRLVANMNATAMNNAVVSVQKQKSSKI